LKNLKNLSLTKKRAKGIAAEPGLDAEKATSNATPHPDPVVVKKKLQLERKADIHQTPQEIIPHKSPAFSFPRLNEVSPCHAGPSWICDLENILTLWKQRLEKSEKDVAENIVAIARNAKNIETNDYAVGINAKNIEKKMDKTSLLSCQYGVFYWKNGDTSTKTKIFSPEFKYTPDYTYGLIGHGGDKVWMMVKNISKSSISIFAENGHDGGWSLQLRLMACGYS